MRRFIQSVAFATLLTTSAGIAQDFGTLGVATFQGRLTNRGVPATGSFDVGLLATTIGDVPVGSFDYIDIAPGPGGTITLDFDYGSLLIGGGGTLDPSAPVFVEIRVRRTGDPTFTTLAPKLPLRTAPRALGAQFAQMAVTTGASSVNSAAIVDGSIAAVDFAPTALLDRLLQTNIDGAHVVDGGIGPAEIAPGAIGAGQVDTAQVQRRVALGCPLVNQSIKTIGADGSATCEPDDGGAGGAGWSLFGNGDAIAGKSFLGTTNSVPLELIVNYERVARFEHRSRTSARAPAVVAGAASNVADSDRIGGTICGGGRVDNVFGDAPNRVRDDWTTICGGAANTAGNSGAVAGGEHATVAGGWNNDAASTGATIGGGVNNDASANYAAIAGGAGGQATGSHSAVGGGASNRAAGFAATAPGGAAVLAGGDYGVALGNRAKVRDAGGPPYGSNEPGCVLGTCGDEGTFAFADAQVADFVSSGPNQFLVRAAGGFGLNTAAPRADLHVFAGSAGAGFVNPLPGTQVLIEGGASTRLSIVTPATAERGIAFMDPSGFTSGLIRYNAEDNINGFSFEVNGVGPGLSILASRNVIVETTIGGASGTLLVQGGLNVGGNIVAANCCAAPSDAKLKRDVVPLAHALERLLDLRGVGFRYRDDAPAWLPREAQIGFVAQQVEAVFPQWVADDPRGFKAVDARGFEALAVEAVRELKAGHDARLDRLSGENAALRAENAALAVRLERIERALAGDIAQATRR